MKSNSDVFLDAYNEIDHDLRVRSGANKYVPYSKLINDSDDKIVRLHSEKLRSYGDLRNAIVHNPKKDNLVIAEPHPEVVEDIEKIKDQLLNPVKVIPKFGIKVKHLNLNDKVYDLLKLIADHDISQFPIFNAEDTEVVEIVNTNTVSRWLSNVQSDQGHLAELDVPIESLLVAIEVKENFRYLSKTSNVYDAYDLFMKNVQSKGYNLDLILITENGKRAESILGVITFQDIIKLVNEIF
ncbi:MAG: hypothetical protein PHU97_09795 [Bacteroidales bacterium]|nr:hypothetical protein [Bacteroidales bacterium]MDD2323791.1 hypothetical protein [Bacteroidales bacterium]MDD3011595.1 hypothetical protein [Bacteroidales bacterium]MDD3962077.1 hypothetical protein [Bacteroidales bacterium]MDY0285665.1 hypothetical protein [Bacteroidales bacterium]